MAIDHEKDVSDIKIPYDVALKIYEEKTLPEKYKETQMAFPGMEKLPPDCQGALVSLVMNRGAALKGKDREGMQEIHDAISSGDYDRVPDIIEDMKNLKKWKDDKGLEERRIQEAELFRKGLRKK